MSSSTSFPSAAHAISLSDYQRHAIAQKLIDFKRTDPLRDCAKPVSAMENDRVADNIGTNTHKIKRKPLPDVVPPKRSEAAVHSTKVHTPTADFPSDGTCELQRRGARRAQANVGPVPSALEDVERRVREVRRIAMKLEK
jgi:hypothetical protein